ncbi:hypothetical protein [Hymenobacter yonginensis]|uniref:Uncharacterized protein n=1 Tax=Hymenobacter yonginensis TaxID=748197 RepID=A0ABY7PP77_9BACT|nr:hypothetical protein [Hymenobacter yonginensis]WBO83790.1 hypothetical protein O9Z63_15580 [Hymenobacter yonginensis]
MLRLLLVSTGLLLAATVAQAQDLLVKHNTEEIQVKVVEVTPTDVRFRRTDNPDGPLYIVRKAEVRLIRYANGTQDEFGPAAPAASAPAPIAGFLPAGTAPAKPPTPPGPVVPGDEEAAGGTVYLGGPRIGATVLTGGVVSKARESVPGLNPFLTQFGWQFETRIFRLANGTSGLFEFVPLLGGLEQGKFIPSLNALFGIRGPKGLEFGLGPNLTPVSASVALAVGTSFRYDGVNFPVNLAVVPGNGGARISLLMGFNSRRR